MDKNVGIISLGCPKNQVDSEIVLGLLASKGYKLTTIEKEAEILIVNTCGFIGPAKEESINAILELAEQKTSGVCKKLIVMGCLSQRYKDELLNDIKEIDYILGTNDFIQLEKVIESWDDTKDRVRQPALFAYPQDFDRILTTPPYSAYLKISEGCSNRCSFCAIPSIRGPYKSIALDILVKEAKRLAVSRVKEINIISQDTTMYGVDLGIKNGLSSLLKKIAAIDSIKWIRLLYCYPTFINNELLDTIKNLKKVCNYIDLPLQHSHDRILSLMLREERGRDIKNIVNKIRDTIPGVAIRTSLIVGFPGETEEHFRSLVQFVEEMRFEHLGVFAYSNEEGTVASGLPGHLPEEVIEARREHIMEIQKKISHENNNKLVGTIQDVLVDGFDKNGDLLLTGRGEWQAPDIDGVIYLEKSEIASGEFAKIKITKAMEYDLIGELVTPP